MSQRFGHPRVLGIPIPKSLAFWASPSHITAAFWVACEQAFGRAPSRDAQIPSALVIPSKKFWISPENRKRFIDILKRRFMRKALQSKTKRLSENLPKSSSMTQN